jgi:E3 ubiquitin-protein ligase RFWD3
MEADRVEEAEEEERENAGNAEVVDLVSEDSNDCTLGKRAREQLAAAPAQVSVDYASDEALCDCPICFEPWGSTGDHRVCCLACGHWFGMGCIKTWLRSTSVLGLVCVCVLVQSWRTVC